MNWTVEGVKSLLASKGLALPESKALDHGTQLIAQQGTRLNVYSSGKVVVQGRKSAEKETIQRIINEATPGMRLGSVRSWRSASLPAGAAQDL